MKFNQSILITLLSALILLNVANKASADSRQLDNAAHLKVVTWNTEHLAFPATNGCKPRDKKALKKLQNYASSLNADVVALQEVASKKAVYQLFPKKDWNVYLSSRANSESYDCRESGATSTQQKVAFAVRKPLKVNNVIPFSELALERDGLRYGLELIIESALGEVALLNVHLKSGCFVDNYSRSDKEACKVLAQQAPILDKWIENKEQQQKPYIVLGDFNHRLSATYNNLTRQLTNNSNGSASSLDITTQNLIGCHPYYPAPIDHILVGHLNDANISKSIKVRPFKNMKPKAMLSDHCAVSLVLTKQDLPLTNSVKWQTTSAEYQFFTEAAYQQATRSLKKLAPKNAWVVVMDIDETVLDNSAYQVNIDKAGKKFTSKSWDDWVISEKATLVPGVKKFIESVLQQGGKLALVTNRSRELDNYTWNNLKSLDIPVSVENTCLMGRTKEDKTAIDHKQIKNDKDLRRQQVTNGTASCFHPKKGRHSEFSKQQIVMQVGDNIEDFAGVVQHDADIEALIKRSGVDLILLPNPMYGSW